MWHLGCLHQRFRGVLQVKKAQIEGEDDACQMKRLSGQ